MHQRHPNINGCAKPSSFRDVTHVLTCWCKAVWGVLWARKKCVKFSKVGGVPSNFFNLGWYSTFKKYSTRKKTHLGWGPRPTWNDSHIPSIHTRRLRIFIWCGWAYGSTIMPLWPYLLAQNLGSWQISWITVRLVQIMSRLIGWGPKPKPRWNGSHIHRIHLIFTSFYVCTFLVDTILWAQLVFAKK
jgi:hypothetical protein